MLKILIGAIVFFVFGVFLILTQPLWISRVSDPLANKDYISAWKDLFDIGLKALTFLSGIIAALLLFFTSTGKELKEHLALRNARKTYLRLLRDRYEFASFQGMGVNDKMPLKIKLLDIYVELKARRLMPEGEAAPSKLRIGGRVFNDEEVKAFGDRFGVPQRLNELLSDLTEDKSKPKSGFVVLGDPGSGKSTFVKWLAKVFAENKGKSLGIGNRLPIVMSFREYVTTLDDDMGLTQAIVEYCKKRLESDLPYERLFNQALSSGKALVLLDGLDEVKDATKRQTVVNQVSDYVSAHREKGNLFVLTSRIVGYKDAPIKLDCLETCTLSDFENEEIESFIQKWTNAVESEANRNPTIAKGEAKTYADNLRRAIQRSRGVRQLASNPLLLTIMALMQRQGITLPDRRVELYGKYIEVLLKHWLAARSLSSKAESAPDIDLASTIPLLAQLALWIQETSPGRGIVNSADAKQKLSEIYANAGDPKPEESAKRLLENAHEDSNLLLELGSGQYGFIHLQLMEYLAGLAIAYKAETSEGQIEVVNLLSQHIDDESDWREVILLAFGCLAIERKSARVASEIMRKLLDQKPGKPGQVESLLGEAIADIGLSVITPDIRKEIFDALLLTLGDTARVDAPHRAAAGRALARLGDPREEVMKVEAMKFCFVPAGPFDMGSDNTDELALSREKLLRENVEVPAFWISQHPISNAQFAQFVKAGGYNKPEYWVEAKAVGYRFDGPHDYGEPYSLPNHPAVGITWFEALAFTRWLTETQTLRGRGLMAALPSETEWEKAARGGHARMRQPKVEDIGGIASGMPLDVEMLIEPAPNRRIYPWGNDKPDDTRANFDGAGINSTSALGCFPLGASPYGCQDMSGNVWEWCFTKWQDNYEHYREDEAFNKEVFKDDRRVVRGGSYFDGDRHVRCAYRIGDDYDPFNLYLGFRLVLRSHLPLISDALNSEPLNT